MLRFMNEAWDLVLKIMDWRVSASWWKRFTTLVPRSLSYLFELGYKRSLFQSSWFTKTESIYKWINKSFIWATNELINEWRKKKHQILQYKPLNSTVGLTLRLPIWPVSTLLLSVLPTLWAIATVSLSSRLSTLTTTRKCTLTLPLLKPDNVAVRSVTLHNEIYRVGLSYTNVKAHAAIQKGIMGSVSFSAVWSNFLVFQRDGKRRQSQARTFEDPSSFVIRHREPRSSNGSDHYPYDTF